MIKAHPPPVGWIQLAEMSILAVDCARCENLARIGRKMSTKKADVNTGGKQSHVGWCKLKRRIASDGAAKMSILKADCIRCENLAHIGMGESRLK